VEVCYNHVSLLVLKTTITKVHAIKLTTMSCLISLELVSKG